MTFILLFSLCLILFLSCVVGWSVLFFSAR